jgi:hypothetical protein
VVFSLSTKVSPTYYPSVSSARPRFQSAGNGTKKPLIWIAFGRAFQTGVGRGFEAARLNVLAGVLFVL